MNAAEALFQLLTSDASIASYVGPHVYPLVVPQEAPRPAIAYQAITEVPTHSQTGYSSHTLTHWQLTIEAITYQQARTIKRLIERAFGSGFPRDVGALRVFSMLVTNSSDGYGDIARVPVIRMDIDMAHNED